MVIIRTPMGVGLSILVTGDLRSPVDGQKFDLGETYGSGFKKKAF